MIAKSNSISRTATSVLGILSDGQIPLEPEICHVLLMDYVEETVTVVLERHQVGSSPCVMEMFIDHCLLG